MNKRLSPILTMGEIYGAGLVYAPRAHSCTSQWVSRDAAMLDYLSGNQLAIMGDMPVIASQGTVCPAGQELMSEAGIEPAKCVRRFCGEEGALCAAREAIGEGRRIVIQHVYRAGVLPEEAFWIEPGLLSYLNNKANLGELVPAERIPRRCASTAEAVFRRYPRRPFPFVLKVATDLSTGAGEGVAVCFDEQDLAAARERFGECEKLIVESFLPIRENLCLHYAVMGDGKVRYLGFARQEIAEGGRYVGNWIDLGCALCPSVVEIGGHVVEHGAAMGYRGIAGIDIAILEDGRAVVLDLNFRVNGSTAAVIFAPGLLKNFGAGVVHLRGFGCAEGFEKMLAVARGAVRRGRLVPLNVFDPVAAGYGGKLARFRGMVMGSCEAEVVAIEAELGSRGLN